MRYGLGPLQSSCDALMNEHLSVLRNADEGCITYYVGSSVEHVKHLKNCTLICLEGFSPNLEGVSLRHVADPQLEFYKLSASYRLDYLDRTRIHFEPTWNAYIHEEAEIGEGVIIGPGTTIGKATIGNGTIIDANVTIYSKTTIGERCEIQSNTVIGAAGMMWVWNNNEKVFLEQLGGVIIESDCRIGSHVEITRGSANENTLIGQGTCMAHGCKLGHGCEIGTHTHMANGILLGGGVRLAGYNFIGSGVIISSGVHIRNEDVILGAGCTVMSDVDKPGVYVGTPAKWLKPTGKGLSGMPTWRDT